MINVNELYLEAKGSWNSLYPIYFDSTKTIAQGRRLPKELSVPSPTVEEIAMCVSNLQIRNLIEPHKMYSRDYFCIGRLKVELNKEQKPANPNVPNKSTLLKRVGTMLVQNRNKK